MENNREKFKLNTPVAIVVAGVIIALAVIFTSGAGTPQVAPDGDINRDGVQDQEIAIKPVTKDDHIRGSFDAPVKIVEFSDIDCPFCARFHPTLQQVVDEYNGQVAWVYRHFPLVSIHPDAPKKAEATECAAELGGNDGFWRYLDYLFESTPITSVDELSQVAGDLGFNRVDFENCLNSGKYAKKIRDHTEDAISSGGRGTPYSIVIAPNGKTFPISGAQGVAAIKAVIDLALQES